MLGYFTLVGLFLLLFSLCFYPAVRELLRPLDDTPLPVDIEYIRRENYFGESFRAKMQEWTREWMRDRMDTDLPLAGAVDGNQSVRAIIEKPDGERIVVFGGGSWKGDRETADVIYCQSDLCLPKDAVFRSEIYAVGNVQAGERTELRSVAADGNIVLEAGTKVSRWVDSRRNVVVRKGTVVGSRVSSAETIELEPGVSAESLYAPRIFTIGFGNRHEALNDSRDDSRIRRSPAGRKKQGADFNGHACTRLGPETRLVQGDLELGSGTAVEENLVVKGTLRTGAQCSFRGSVKANGLALGALNNIEGNVVSTKAIEIGRSTHVAGSVIAEQDILLRSGVRVGRVGCFAVVSAGKNVTLEANVAVSGKIAAGRAVITV